MDKECEYCKELNKEKKPVYIYEVVTGCHDYFFWNCQIRYCPYCGKRLKIMCKKKGDKT